MRHNGSGFTVVLPDKTNAVGIDVNFFNSLGGIILQEIRLGIIAGQGMANKRILVGLTKIDNW